MDRRLLLGSALALPLAGRAFAADEETDARAVKAWLAREATPITRADPAAPGGDADLAPLSAVVGRSRIVGFGEATHGTREIFQLKDRAFRRLVEHDGFTGFAIEANFAEAEAIDAWVKGGPGDPVALIGAMGFWTWDTEEVVVLVRWMRGWNDSHARKLSFYGVDMQFAPSNLGLAFDFLERFDRAAAPSRAPFAAYVAAATDTGAGYVATARYTAEEGRVLREASAALFRRFEDGRGALVAAGGEAGYLRARSAAMAAAWYFVMEGPTGDRRFTGLRLGYDVRDRAMADLARAALEREGEEGRLFLWAHNAHVAKARHVDERLTLGGFLADDLGADYVAVGFAFDHGTFQAMPPADPATPGVKPRLSEMRVGPAPDDHSEAVLRRGPSPLWLADLRRLDPGTPAYRWFQARRSLRWTGANYSTELMAKHPPSSLSASYDALIFVAATTRARPNPATRARHGIEKTW